MAYADEKVGSLRGELAFADKTAPANLTISMSRIRAGSFSMNSPDSKYLTIKDHKFFIEGLPEGRYSLTILGDEFLDLSIKEVIIEANKETNLGSLLVSRGKTLQGVVLDSKGAPVSGATVVIDESLFIYNQQEPSSDRKAVSGADGSFSLRALPASPLLLFATLANLGDSVVMAISDKQEKVSVALSATGSVSGSISYDGKSATAVVLAIPLLEGKLSRAQLFCRTSNGAYSLVLAPGEYLLVADLSKEGTEAIYMPSKTKRITVEANKKLAVDLEIPKGATVLITPPKDLSKKADYASFYLLPGTKAPKDAAALQALQQQSNPEELRQTSMHLDDAEARLEDVLPGKYLLCGYTSRVGLGESVVQCQKLTVKQKTQQRVSLKLMAPSSK